MPDIIGKDGASSSTDLSNSEKSICMKLFAGFEAGTT
jgi:hypothetical protein